jgi:hypothetical protein
MKYTHKQAEFLFNRELTMQAEAIKKNDHQALSVPMLVGPPGIGKTEIARAAAQRLNLPFLPINCGESTDASDILGIPSEKKDGGGGLFTEWILNKYATQACLKPVFLLFDDMDKSPDVVQGALLSVTANRTFRDKSLNPRTIIACAGNGVSDDILANEICESLRTRITVISMIPDVLSYSQHGISTGTVHPSIVGYLQFKPEHLHAHKEGVPRFPTPRGWTEASKHFFQFPNPREDIFGNRTNNNWKTIVALKLGDHVANDFWAWHEILSSIDVEGILTGAKKFDNSGDPSERRMRQYAAIFALATWLNTHPIKPTYTGLLDWITSVDPEMQIALIVQLKSTVRTKIAEVFPEVADELMAELISTGDHKTKASKK